MDIRSLDNSLAGLIILKVGRVFPYMEAGSSLLNQIRIEQFNDGDLCNIQDKVLQREANEEIIDGGYFLQ